jgi:3-hydroxy-D-aspartate aldolase
VWKAVFCHPAGAGTLIVHATIHAMSGIPSSQPPRAAPSAPNPPRTVTRRSVNAALVGIPGGRRMLSTPALVLDLPALERNLATMADWARARGVALRPHAKTHKCTEIARRQVQLGALGVCCATIAEAEAMVLAGIPGVTVTSPLTTVAKLKRLAALKPHARDLSVVIESPENLARLREVCAPVPGPAIGLLVDLDIGHGRTGVADRDAAVALARLADSTPGFAWRGVQAYAGHLQHLDRSDERRSRSAAALGVLREVIAALDAAGLRPQVVSGAGTGTAWADGDLDLFTELQVGSYAVMDVEYGQLEWPAGGCPFEYALFVATSVVSTQQAGGVVFDGGHKAFATDGPLPMLAAGLRDPALAALPVQRRGDEHIEVGATADRLGVVEGDVVEFVVPHCDPTVNLYDFFCVVSGDALVDVWPIEGRGHG